jgi:hypothetical protein
MKARITFYIGLFVILLNTIQLFVSFDAVRFVGIAVGLFFVFWGLRIGWTQNRNLTIIVGHIALTIGCLVTAYAIYQIPFLESAPTYLEVLDFPLFWGFFIIWGGHCMITHGYCSCAIKMNQRNNNIKIPT